MWRSVVRQTCNRISRLSKPSKLENGRPLVRICARTMSEKAPGGVVRKSPTTLNGRFSTLAYRSLALMLATGAGIYFYFDLEKAKAEKLQEQRDAARAAGKPKVGGPFELVGKGNKIVTNKDFLGKFMLIYFGFTNCPDICPEELDKVAEVLNAMDERQVLKVTPVFVSVDPKRDTIELVEKYLQDFHPRMVGLVGTYEAVKAAARAYRVYFSSPPPEEVTDDDYLVDHSIFMYLMDPNGEFVDAYGKNVTADQFREKMVQRIIDWERQNGEIKVEN